MKLIRATWKNVFRIRGCEALKAQDAWDFQAEVVADKLKELGGIPKTPSTIDRNGGTHS